MNPSDSTNLSSQMDNDDDSLLSTKLILPRCHGQLVHRQRLFDKLGTEPQSLSLVCAPAGFGKTTLLTRWLEQQKIPVAWLSLDEDDNDPTRFLHYVIKTIQCIYPQFGLKEASILALAQPPNVISLLRSLVNQISSLDSRFFLALDDYHVIEHDAVHEVLNYLIDHQPSQLHVAMTSRSIPPIALSRMRVRRQLAEIGESDLRFTHEEAAQFLNKITGLDLSSEDISVLEARTEGWIAGLQLAAISLEAENDRTAFIQAFAGDDRYIMDYLTDEVLRRQPEDIKQFLLHTSVLNQLCGSLCDKLTQRKNSTALLEQLETSNMFVIPLDNKRHWYRYHHLFSELLREQLVRLQPAKIVPLHRHASEWFNEKGLPHEAIKHAFEIEDFEQAATVLEKHGQRMFEDGQLLELMTYYQKLPKSIIKNHPCHMLRCTWSHFLGCGEILLDLVEELQRQFDSGQLELSDEEHAKIEIDLALMKGFLAMQQRDIAVVEDCANRAIQFCETIGMSAAIPPRLLLASAHFVRGRLDKAGEIFRLLIDDSFSSEYLLALNASICGFARVLAKQGHLNEARKLLTENLRRLQEKGWDEYLADTAWVYMALSELAYQTNNLGECMLHLENVAGIEHKDTWNVLPSMIDVRRANVYFARGDVEKAIKCIAAIKHPEIKPSLLPIFPISEDDLLSAQIKLGDMSQVEHWLATKSFEVSHEADFEREGESVLLARVLVRQGQADKALNVISPLLLRAEQEGHQTLAIELLVLQAMARQSQGKTRLAIVSLERALNAAKLEQHIRVFLDEGAPVAALLKHALAGRQSEYAQILLQQMSNEPAKNQTNDLPVEPLSHKERKTLALLVAGLTNKEIAEQLFVSPNTIKTHVKNIYRKLGVNSRVEAVAKGAGFVNPA